MTSLNNKIVPMMLVVAGIGLSACSSKPAPWAESQSPWENRAEDSGVQPVVMEEAEPVMATDMPAMEVAPVEMTAMEQDAMPGDAQAVMSGTGMMEAEPVVTESMDMAVAEAPMMPVTGSLAQQPANYFAVQVVASSTMKQATDFAQANNISEQWIAETSVNGKTWYVLMLGVYPNRAEADQALASVKDLNTQPWVRTVGSIQSVMMN